MSSHMHPSDVQNCLWTISLQVGSFLLKVTLVFCVACGVVLLEIASDHHQILMVLRTYHLQLLCSYPIFPA
jgi:hypothetical protein